MVVMVSEVYRPRRGNAVKLRICVSRYAFAIGDRLLKFLRVLRLLRFPECATIRKRHFDRRDLCGMTLQGSLGLC